MKEIRTEITINATTERVWTVLTDFRSFPQWNPFITYAEGELTPGQTLTVRLQTPSGKGWTFKAKVLVAEPNRELRWMGRLGLPGILDGGCYYIIEVTDDGGIRFIQGERFRGILVPILGVMGMLNDTLLGFTNLNQALKARAEETEAS
ncbi:MAG: hypothetical protein BZY75_06175 [SAR202 cluster bacterium Io17-Chloro-G7]|nr:MAG: hypothetical protein BZY75_06175 [SAR202 cluster bacterium Io17-Chloro-G7]